MAPATRLRRPVTVTDASLSVGVATTTTEVVPLTRLTVLPLATVEPLTVKVDRVFTFERAETVTVTVRLATVPSAAVTVMVTVLLPVTRPVRPAMVTPAAESAAVATTATEVVPAATITVPFSATVWPLMLIADSRVSLLSD